MGALICGSMAYDTIMVFHDKFKNHILPDKVHILNVSFLVPTMRREYGGCAGNIAYNLNLLGEQAFIMATVGHDFEPYSQWLSQNGLSGEFIHIMDNQYTGQAYITTDEEGNQITAFHPGAMDCSHLYAVPASDDISIGIVSPDGKQGMMAHAEQFSEQGIPFIFDPGQGMPMFDGDELLELVGQATWLTLNDYESQLMQERTGLTLAQLAARVSALVVTLGGQGSIVYTNGHSIQIPPAKLHALRDPTGCGDAYRAGLLYGLMNDLDWPTTGRVASLMGAIKIEHHGTQNHRFSMASFKQRFLENYGYLF